MLTAMTEEDWTIVLRVFAASRSRRGDKGRNDRKFLEALHYLLVHNSGGLRHTMPNLSNGHELPAPQSLVSAAEPPPTGSVTPVQQEPSNGDSQSP
jgi:hypothetical protein